MKKFLFYISLILSYYGCTSDDQPKEAIEDTNPNQQQKVTDLQTKSIQDSPRAYDKSYDRPWNLHVSNSKTSHMINSDYAPGYHHPKYSKWPQHIFTYGQYVNIVEKQKNWSRTQSNLWIPSRYIEDLSAKAH